MFRFNFSVKYKLQNAVNSMSRAVLYPGLSVVELKKNIMVCTFVKQM